MDNDDTAAWDPAVWRSPAMARSRDWLYNLTTDDVAEIEAAISALRGRDMLEVTRADFPLPRFGGILRDIARELIEGRGFVLLRGLPVEAWPRAKAALAYWGIARYFGDPVSQNALGHLLGHVKDIGKDPQDPVTRIYQTRHRQPYHVDSCDIVGLLCLRKSISGGASRIVSSTTLYHEITRRRPDLAAVLAEPFYTDRKGEIPEGKGPFYEMPVFHDHGGRITVYYVRDFIEAAQRMAEVPRLTALQIEAMDLLDELAEDPEFHLEIAFEPGDMQFLHNHQILHARTAYEDHAELALRRHLLRLWLSAPEGRELPPAYAERYGDIALGGLRGGIMVPGVRLSAPLEVD